MSVDEKLQDVINGWIINLADQYDGMSDRMKELFADAPAADEEWDVLLKQIKQIMSVEFLESFEKALRNKLINKEWEKQNAPMSQHIFESMEPNIEVKEILEIARGS